MQKFEFKTIFALDLNARNKSLQLNVLEFKYLDPTDNKSHTFFIEHKEIYFYYREPLNDRTEPNAGDSIELRELDNSALIFVLYNDHVYIDSITKPNINNLPVSMSNFSIKKCIDIVTQVITYFNLYGFNLRYMRLLDAAIFYYDSMHVNAKLLRFLTRTDEMQNCSIYSKYGFYSDNLTKKETRNLKQLRDKITEIKYFDLNDEFTKEFNMPFPKINMILNLSDSVIQSITFVEVLQKLISERQNKIFECAVADIFHNLYIITEKKESDFNYDSIIRILIQINEILYLNFLNMKKHME